MSSAQSVGRRALLLLGAAALGALAVGGWWITRLAQRDPVDRLAWIEERVRRQFPAAPQISTAALAERLAAGERPVLLDVRRPEEFAVSHLEGAVRIDPGSDRLPDSARRAIADGAPVVAYCSVGWRSSRLVEDLRSRGIEAWNLEGSIFRWAVEDRPLVREGRPVEVVHPYGPAWAWLVGDRAASEVP